jgi:hypothetical protein
MPWRVEKQGNRYCVVKIGGGVVACHDSRVQAIKQQRALYANEPSARRASMDSATEADTRYMEQLEVRQAEANNRALQALQSMLGPITAAVAPLKPPREWLEFPEADEPTPLTITADGQIFGHLALWETCHRGFLNGTYSECIKAPRSQTNYEQFYAGGQMQADDGEMLPVGRLTYDTSHAPLTADLRAAARHYDSTGAVGGFARAMDGQYGIWLSGVARSDLSPEGLRDLRANPPSGDWRLLRTNQLELVASLAVPVPGFPVARSQLALAASVDGGLEVTALILTGPTSEDLEDTGRSSRAYLRRRNSLAAALRK